MKVRLLKSQIPSHMIKNFLGVDLVFFSFVDRGTVATAVDVHRPARVAFAFGIHWAVSLHPPSLENSLGALGTFLKFFNEF